MKFEKFDFFGFLMFLGSLPWFRLNGGYHETALTKLKTSVQDLCGEMGQKFCDFANAVLNLQFAEEPDYDEYQAIFESILSEYNVR